MAMPVKEQGHFAKKVRTRPPGLLSVKRTVPQLWTWLMSQSKVIEKKM